MLAWREHWFCHLPIDTPQDAARKVPYNMQDSPFIELPPSELQTPVAKKRSGVRAILFTLAGMLVVAMLTVGGVLIVVAKNTPKPPPTLASILQQATAAMPQDASFTLENTSSTSIGSLSITLKHTGTGDIGNAPFQLHVTLNDGSSDGATSFTSNETIVQAGTMYIKLPQFPNIPGFKNPFGSKPWVKLPYADLSGTSGTNPLAGFTVENYLDYQRLTDVKLIGSATIAGKATWHLHGTLASAAPTNSSFGTTAASNSEDLWVLKSSYLPAQMTFHAATALTTGGTGGTSLTISSDETVTFIRWNSGVLISVPSSDQVSDGFSGLLPPTPTPAPKH